MKLFCNNKAAISIINNPVQHDRTKYVEIDQHSIKEKLNNGSIYIPYIPLAKLLMFLSRGFSYRALIHVLASWVSLISTSQLQGEC